MTLGGAVHPQGFSIVDLDGEDFHHVTVWGHGPGVDAGYVGHDLVDWFAGPIEGGLGDGVVLGLKVLVYCC